MSAPSPRWLVSRTFDLLWFFGGAALSLLVLFLYFVAGAPIVALWWIWLLAFDGPHIAASFTRTYLDADEWRRRPALLLAGARGHCPDLPRPDAADEHDGIAAWLAGCAGHRRDGA